MSTTGDRSNESPHSQPKGEVRRWRRRFRVVSVGTTAAGIAVFGALMLSSAQESSAATALSATAVPVGVGSDGAPAPTPSMPADMPGMDMSGSSPTPPPPAGMSPDMPGMDMSGGSGGAAVHRPLAPVLGTFGGGTAAVLLTAGMMRRKDRARSLAKKAARLAGRGRK
jgi:hypothetical protein